MKKYLFAVLINLFVFHVIHAQLFDHVYGYDSQFGRSYGSKIAIDTSGDYYLAGTFSDKIDVDPSSGTYNLSTRSSSNYDIFICKYSNNSKLIWAKSLVNLRFCGITQIALDPNQNLIVTGWFRDSIDLDPSSNKAMRYSINAYSLFIAKFDQNGNFIWGNSFHGEMEIYNELCVTSDSSIYMSFHFTDTIDVDHSSKQKLLISRVRGKNDIALCKYDSKGDLIWAGQVKGAGKGAIQSLAVNRNGNLIVAYTGIDTMDIGINGKQQLLAGDTTSFSFFAKYSKQGEFITSGAFSSSRLVRVYELQINNNNNITVSGFFRDTTDFDPDTSVYGILPNNRLQSNLYIGFYVCQMDSNFNFKWVRTSLMSNNPLFINSSALDPKNGDIYITGSFSDSIFYHPDNPQKWKKSVGNRDIFIVRYSKDGVFGGFKSIGGKMDDDGNGVAIGKDQHIFITGNFEGLVDFDPSGSGHNLTTSSNENVFVLKQKQCITSSKVFRRETLCGPRLSPSKKYLWTKSGTYNDTLHTDNGCDSIVNLTLTINPRHFMEIDTIVCGRYTPPSGKAVYFKTGVYYDSLKTRKGCDSVYKINLEIRSTSFSLNNQRVCNKLLSPSGRHLWTSTGKYSDTLVAANGCDSIVIIDLIVDDLTSRQTIFSCQPFKSPSGMYMWSTSGTYLDTIFDAAGIGCDSFFVIKFTRGYESLSTTSFTSCDSFLSPSKRYVWRSSGTYKDTIQNESGCDSIMTIKLTILESTGHTITPFECYSYTSPSGKYSWNRTGIYSDTLVNAISCDSVITINLTIRGNSYETIQPTSCFSYTTPSGKFIHRSSGTYLDTISSIHGCDSILTINLTVNTVDTSVTTNQNHLISNAPNAKYQWFDCSSGYDPIQNATNRVYFAKSVGAYAVSVEQNTCVDTSFCYSVNELSAVVKTELDKISVYPNPTNGAFHISFLTSIEKGDVSVTDVNGQTVFNKTFINQKEVDLNVQHLATGTYILYVQTTSQFRVMKLVKL